MENKEHWESVGADYSLSWTTPAKELLSRKELDFVARHVPDNPTAVLDVGIGNGRILERLLRATRTAQVYGVDVAESMVGACRARFGDEPRIVALSVCDISVEPVPFGITFDFISTIRVLKYSRNWPEIVAKLVAQLAVPAAEGPDQARLVFTMPNRNSISRFSRAYAVPWETTTIDKLTQLCARLGVTVVEMVGFGRLPFAAYQIGRPRWLSKSVVLTEDLLTKVLGRTFLTRELFVAVAVDGGRSVLRAGPDRITTKPRSGVVEKAFVGGPAIDRQHEAEQEFQRLQRLHGVVATVPGAASARPLEVMLGPSPTIRMEAVPGRPLLEVLASEDMSPPRLTGAAVTAGQVLVAYVTASGEPYPDFQFDNMLYDEPSGTVGFVDLGVPDQGVPDPSGMTPLEVSLGHLVGSTIFQSVRPKWLRRLRQRRQAAELCAAIVNYAVLASTTPVATDRIRLAAHDAYRRCARGGSRGKRLWYATGGYVLASRIRVPDAVIGPSWPDGRHEGGTTRSPR